MQTADWQEQLRDAVRSAAELSLILDIELGDTSTNFPMLVPRAYVDRMEKHNPLDPLLLQVLPTDQESAPQPGFMADPLTETTLPQVTRGLIQKYQGRALVITTGTCAINCRYCFRRHFPYADSQPGNSEWQALVHTIESDPSIHEVILSGGDPLMLHDEKLARYVRDIEQLDQIESIRIHTRMPVVLPSRVCDDLLGWIRKCTKPVVIVLHVNHPNEIDDEVANALGRLRSAGATLLNQSVLLKSVNDSSETLIGLSKRLFSAGVLPYYLHLLDPVTGAAHFDVHGDEGLKLIKAMSAALPGYLVPKLVREVPGTDAKQPYPPA